MVRSFMYMCVNSKSDYKYAPQSGRFVVKLLDLSFDDGSLRLLDRDPWENEHLSIHSTK